MDTNDAVFAAEADVDQVMRSRNRGGASRGRAQPRERSTKSGDNSPIRDADNEQAPLLSSEGSVDGDNGSSPPEWFGITELQGLPWWKRPSIFWLIPPFLLSTIAFGGIIVPKLNLILELICHDYYADQSTDIGPLKLGEEAKNCRTDEVSSRVALFLLYGSLCSGILSAITSPKLGALSDRYGRKKLLMVTTLGMLVGEILTIFAAKYPETVDVNWIIVGYAVDGLCGSFIVGMALAHSYATDCTPPQKRNVAFAYFHACLFTGIAIGPILAGKIIKNTGSVLLVFYLALGAHLIFIGFLLFIPESLSKARQETAREKYRAEIELLGPAADWINQLRSVNLFRPLKILYPTGPGSSSALRWNLLLLAATDTIVFGVAMGAMGVIVIYLNREFGWGNYETSKFVSIVNTSRVLALLVLLPIVTRLVRGREGTTAQKNSGSDRFDLYVIRFAILFDMLGYLGYSLSRDGNLFILSGAIASIGGVGSPTLGSALTKHVPPNRTGQLLGATGLLHALARIIGPTVFNGIYSATVGSFRQTVFVCLTATFGVAFMCSWFIRPHVYLEDLEEDGSHRRSSSPNQEDPTIQ
ncbi:tetracycline-efflux transporter-like protein [Clohesyomyces aquaticus]|uniref:Tetracycline-efflux transporter-like protein n=1 Tax=Clohesyomyces aquaticus TaxID=1231657 RepID=A0A1Y1ZY32_9PLEO|nr:tetracycline-efflux transporter-like protein [Clohesyomyces aquaticus]